MDVIHTISEIHPVGSLSLKIEISGILLAVTFLGLIVPGFAVQARRLHDINQTGWLVLAGVALNILAGLGTIFYIVIGVLPPVDADNRYND